MVKARAKRNNKITKHTATKKNLEKNVTHKIPFWPFGLGLFALLLFADQYSKYNIMHTMSVGSSHKIWSILSFNYIQNTGAIWGSLQDTNAMFVWISVIIFGLLIFFYDHFQTTFEKIAYTLLLAGLWGNLLDRALHGFVIDFIAIGWWPRFNIADSCITIGIAIYLLEQIKQNNHVKQQRQIKTKRKRTSHT